MRINNAKNFNGDVYLTNRFSESGITVQDTSNALVFNTQSNSSALKFHHTKQLYDDFNDRNVSVSTSLTVNHNGFYFSKDVPNYDYGSQHSESVYSNSLFYDGNTFKVDIQNYLMADDKFFGTSLNFSPNHFSIGATIIADNFNFHSDIDAGISDIYVPEMTFNTSGFTFNAYSNYSSDGRATFNTGDMTFNTGDMTFNTGDMTFNTGDMTFNTGDMVIINFNDNSDIWDYNTKIDLTNQLILSQKSHYLTNFAASFYEKSEIKFNNATAKISVTYYPNKEQISEDRWDGDSFTGLINTDYEFKHNGLYYNGNPPNTAGGFAMFDSNSRIPGMVGASKVKFDMNSNSYVLKLTLKDSSSNSLSSDTVDLPLESMVVNGRYDSNSKNVVLTLKNGNDVSFSVADLVNGLQKSLTAGKSITIDSNSNIGVNCYDLMFEDGTNNGYRIGLEDMNMGGDAYVSFNVNTATIGGSGNDAGSLWNESHTITVDNDKAQIAFSHTANVQDEWDESYSTTFEFTKTGDIQLNGHGTNQPNGLVRLNEFGQIPTAILGTGSITAWEVYANDTEIPIGSNAALGGYVNVVIPAQMWEEFNIRSVTSYNNNDVVVDWGDGVKKSIKNQDYETSTVNSDNEYTYCFKHTYTTPGKYIVRIYGKDYFSVNHLIGNGNLTSPNAAGLLCRCFDADLPIASHLRNLASFAFNSPRLLNVKMPSTYPIEGVTNLANCFRRCLNLITVTGFSSKTAWKKIDTLRSIFMADTALTTCDFNLPESVSREQGLWEAFSGCSKLTSPVSALLPVNGFSSKKVGLVGTFANCSSLTDGIPAKLLWNDFTKDWVTYAVPSYKTFSGCSQALLAQVPISWGGTNDDVVAYTEPNGLLRLDSNSRIPDASYQHIEKVVKTLSGYITDNVVTIDDLAPGLVVAVINDTGKQVYPDIQYVNGRAIITADFETNSPDTSWAIFKVNYLTF